MRFLKKILLYMIGNFSGKLLVVFLIPIYALYVTKEDLGMFDYMQTIMNIGLVLCFMAIWESVIRFLLVESPEVQSQNTNTIVIFSLSVAIVVFIITIFVVTFFGLNIEIAFSDALMNSFYGLAQVWQYFSRAYERNGCYVVSGIIGTVVNFLLVVLMVCIYKGGLLGLLFSYAMGRVCIFIYLESRLKLLGSIRFTDFHWIDLCHILRFSFPLAINSLAGWLLGGVGTMLITWYFGMEANGLYAFANKFSALIISIGSIFIMALIEESIIELKTVNSNSKIKDYFSLVSELFMSGILLLVPAISIFYEIIVSMEYADSKQYIPFILLYALFSVLAAAVGAFFHALDMTKYQFTTTMLGAIVTWVVSLVLIRIAGVFSVLIGQVGGAFLMMLVRFVIVNSRFELKFEKSKIVIFCFEYFVLTMILYRVSSLWVLIVSFVVIVMEIIIINKKRINFIIALIKKYARTGR